MPVSKRQILDTARAAVAEARAREQAASLDRERPTPAEIDRQKLEAAEAAHPATPTDRAGTPDAHRKGE
jgi:hypothetical protein